MGLYSISHRSITAAFYLTDRGPIFFVQYRVGLNGPMFPLYSFVRWSQMRTHLKVDEKTNSGPRIQDEKETHGLRIGPSFERAASMNSRLFNVLRGHMSLVGPRPHLAEEVQHYSTEQYRRLLVTRHMYLAGLQPIR